MRELIHRFDTSLTAYIAGWPLSLQPFFHFITALGDPVVTVGIGLVVTTWGLAQSSMRLVLAGSTVWLTLGVGALLKLLVARDRPLTEYAANITLSTFSFPSGHTSGATIAYGLLAYLAWRLLPQPWSYVAVAVLVGLIVLVGISRVYLGAHFPSDVVAGWLLGIAALLVIVYVIRPLV